MADNNEKTSKRIERALDKIDLQTSDLYRSTYYSSDITDIIQGKVTDDLNDAIKAAIDGDDEYTNISNTTKLFLKIQSDVTEKSVFGKDGISGIEELFTGNEMTASIMDSFSKSKWIKEMDKEYDSICKYMPKLQAALDIKRDCVLCADTFTKEFLNITTKATGLGQDKDVILNNINELKEKYELESKVESWYEDTSKYGEVFIYCVPYKTALNALLKNKGNTSYTVSEGAYDAVKSIIESAPVDSILIDANSLNISSKIKANVVAESNEEGGFSITIHPDNNGFLTDLVKTNTYLREAAGLNKFRSLSESFVLESGEKFSDHMHGSGKDIEIKLDRTIDDEIKYEDDDKTASDGLSSSAGKNATGNLKVNGAILKTLPHDKVIPVYIEDTLFGVYYLKYDIENDDMPTSMLGLSSTALAANRNPIGDQSSVDNGDLFLKRIAAKVSQEIDKAFINANVDLKKEIYLLLSYNDKYNNLNKNLDMSVVFIPADDIYHLTFKKDPASHRGISDLYNSLVPAKQWIILNLTSTLGQATRGYDRRAYYVKQSLDTNTATSLLNVINTIKKGNFGVRQMESINNIIGMLGRFNDFVVPVGTSGEAPIQFETIPGQSFDFPTDLMNTNEEAAVNATEVPIEIVNSSAGMDFAVRFTMTNSKFLRSVLKRQFFMELCGSFIATKLYKYEYNDNLELEITLPMPAFLSMTQGTQILQTAVQYAEAIAEIEMAGESDEAKAAFKKVIIRKLMPSYMSDDDIKKIKNDVKFKLSEDKNKPEEDY